MWGAIYRDLDAVPALREPMAEFQAYLDGIREDLLESWSPPKDARKRVRTVLGHAVRFETWRSLARGEIGDPDVAGMMVAWIAALASADPLPAP